jgi:hypothetical protein
MVRDYGGALLITLIGVALFWSAGWVANLSRL